MGYSRIVFGILLLCSTSDLLAASKSDQAALKTICSFGKNLPKDIGSKFASLANDTMAQLKTIGDSASQGGTALKNLAQDPAKPFQDAASGFESCLNGKASYKALKEVPQSFSDAAESIQQFGSDAIENASVDGLKNVASTCGTAAKDYMKSKLPGQGNPEAVKTCFQNLFNANAISNSLKDTSAAFRDLQNSAAAMSTTSFGAMTSGFGDCMGKTFASVDSAVSNFDFATYVNQTASQYGSCFAQGTGLQTLGDSFQSIEEMMSGVKFSPASLLKETQACIGSSATKVAASFDPRARIGTEVAQIGIRASAAGADLKGSVKKLSALFSGKYPGGESFIKNIKTVCKKYQR